MEIFYTNELLQPLSTNYIGDSELSFRGLDLQTDDGLLFRKENYLLSAVATNINNYNALFLTSNQLNNDIFSLRRLKLPKASVLTTSMKQSDKYLAIDVDFESVTTSNEASQRTSFEIEMLPDKINCSIAHQNEFNRYYLHYNGSFYFSKTKSALFSQFKYAIHDNKFYLFAKRTVNLFSIAINPISNTLVALPYAGWKNNSFDVNPYTQDHVYDIDTSWASYDVADRNKLVVDPARSATHLPNNTIVYNNYTYISGGEIQSNFISLKNNHTHKHNSFRANYLNITDPNAPNVQARDYTSMHTGVNQEGGSDAITLTYEFYNADYKFAADKYTIFTTPASLYPYEQINVNDTLLARNGAIAGSTPYTADKIFCKDTRARKMDGQYMCTWLSGADAQGASVWVDRYYIPEKTSFAQALTSRSYYSYRSPVESYITADLPVSGYYDSLFVWESIEEELAHTPQDLQDVLFGEYFFDKRSDMVFVPDSEYIYYRVGNNYVNSVIDSLSSNLIQSGLDLKTAKGVNIEYDLATDAIEYVMDGDSYSMVESFRDINDTNQATISFWMHADDWSKSFGHEIIGNYNDRGFGVLNDQLVTPIITVQDGRRVVYLNTDFDVIDTVYLSQSALQPQTDIRKVSDSTYITTYTTINGFLIKDLHRTDHLDVMLPTIAAYTDSLTAREADPHAAFQSACGLLNTEDGVPLRLDNNFTTTGAAITGIIVEPCSDSTGMTPT